jgi:hypothetical protein
MVFIINLVVMCYQVGYRKYIKLRELDYYGKDADA